VGPAAHKEKKKTDQGTRNYKISERLAHVSTILFDAILAFANILTSHVVILRMKYLEYTSFN
jgi:hypothetical protein